MMIKIFTTNKNNKIEITKEELKSLLDEAYWDGYRANGHSWTYTSPSNWSPYITTCSTGTYTTTNATITITSNDLNSNTGTITTDDTKTKISY